MYIYCILYKIELFFCKIIFYKKPKSNVYINKKCKAATVKKLSKRKARLSSNAAIELSSWKPTL